MPGNTRWETVRQQIRSRPDRWKVKYRGRIRLVTDLARQFGISVSSFSWRLRQGLSPEKIIALPKERGSCFLTVNGITHTVTVWGKLKGFSTRTLWFRLNNGCPLSRLFERPKNGAKLIRWKTSRIGATCSR
jgi:hypothetical protein